MRRVVFCAAMMMALTAGAAGAQGVHGALFISPMGQPYRAADAETAPITLWMTAADTDADGRMSREEFLANATAFFARLDANDDGAAVSRESNALWARHAPELLTGYVSSGPSQMELRDQRRDLVSGIPVEDSARVVARAQPAQGAQGYGLLNDIEPVMTCDGNFDRRVNQAEFDACAARRFALIDLNHDGAFTLDEAQQH